MKMNSLGWKSSIKEIYGLGYILDRKGSILSFYSENKRANLYANSRIVVSGHGRISLDAIKFSAKAHGMIAIRKYSTVIRFDYPSSPRALIVKAQLRLLNDLDSALYVAKKFVEASSLNKCYILNSLIAYDLDLEAERDKILELLKSDISSLQDLRSVEALITKEYFNALRKVISSIYGFEARTRRPPRDCFNAALSYALMVLYRYVKTALECVGLDSRIGYLHEPFRKRPSLALDLAEEFKQPIVDAVLLTLFMTEAMSVKRDFRRDGEAVYLGVRGRKKVDKALRRRFSFKIGGVSFLERIYQQAEKLAEYIIGKRSDYEPFIYDRYLRS
ncbi:MAG: CRISPR-associated endonuclease Cas1 [Thermoprotei archaeon]|nr:MAG: CRISPR-associated endonuclease Cas1 [Thermoprotei archaeon]